jgi:hypothetical protein
MLHCLSRVQWVLVVTHVCVLLPFGGVSMGVLLLQSSSHSVRADVDFDRLWATIGARLRSCLYFVTMSRTMGVDGGQAITFRSLSVDGITAAVSIFWEVCVLSCVSFCPVVAWLDNVLTGTVAGDVGTLVGRGVMTYRVWYPCGVVSFSGLFVVCIRRRGQDFHGLTLDQFSVKKPEYWDDSVASPARVRVAKGTPEWALVTSKFHVNGFNKPIIGIERVQVWSCVVGWACRVSCL